MQGDSVIIVAGGEGKRMGQPIPKQFLMLGDYPVLWHSLLAFHNYDPDIPVILVLHKDWIAYWQEETRRFFPSLNYKITPGGETRFHSVRNGLTLIPEGDFTAVHDASRPLVSSALIERTFRAAREKGNAIPVLPATDSLRILTPEGNRPLDRRQVRYVQTPQIFPTDLLKKAFRQEYRPEFTDEATVVERLGKTIHMIEGEKRNIKITTGFDSKVARLLLNSNNQ
ncbi:MAG TPA: 2-C-methyl-D-erythritol 4-phosphate cytidylyltransferase [Bacteroidetes bacterium]|nr:2-C-methyl-D-erythritol 4-phosphate cytidylyltransferase [Bacteroidota bacterium]